MLLFLPILATIPQGNQGAQVMSRLANYVRSAKSMRADLTLTSNQMAGPGVARMIYVRPNRLCYTVKWKDMDYRFVGNSFGSWDADYAEKQYDETTEWGFSYPHSRFSYATDVITPGFLMDGTLRSDLILGVKYEGKKTVNGIQTDQVHGASQICQVDLFVAADGRPVRYINHHSNGFSVTADITNIALNKSEPATLFGNNPPIGFKETTVPVKVFPIGVGQRFPLTGWSAKAGASLAALNSSKPTLVIVTTEGCQPSGRSAGSLQRLQAEGKMNVAVVSLSRTGGEPSSLTKFPEFYDGSGKMADKVNAPGTPLFYLLASGGKVLKIWYGYDPDSAAAFESDINQTLNPPKEEAKARGRHG